MNIGTLLLSVYNPQERLYEHQVAYLDTSEPLEKNRLYFCNLKREIIDDVVILEQPCHDVMHIDINLIEETLLNDSVSLNDATYPIKTETRYILQMDGQGTLQMDDEGFFFSNRMKYSEIVFLKLPAGKAMYKNQNIIDYLIYKNDLLKNYIQIPNLMGISFSSLILEESTYINLEDHSYIGGIQSDQPCLICGDKCPCPIGQRCVDGECIPVKSCNGACGGTCQGVCPDGYECKLNANGLFGCQSRPSGWQKFSSTVMSNTTIIIIIMIVIAIIFAMFMVGLNN